MATGRGTIAKGFWKDCKDSTLRQIGDEWQVTHHEHTEDENFEILERLWKEKNVKQPIK